MAEDRFVKDLIEADYKSEDEDGDESEVRLCLPLRLSRLYCQGEAGKKMKSDRKARDLRKAQESAQQRRNEQVLRDMLNEQSGSSE
jgi:hypothetical protein